MNRVKETHTAFKSFREDMSNVWREYCFLKDCISSTPVMEYPMKNLHSNNVVIKKGKIAGGMKTRFLTGVNASNHLIQAIGLFERYISSLAEMVYLDYPGKISGGMDGKKMFQVILDSEDKEAILKALAEEKVRSVFYGRPRDIFEKDDFDLMLKKAFTETYKDAMPLYQELTSRRNIIIHNSSRIEKKYLKENPDSPFKKGEKVVISGDYLRGAIGLLLGIAAITTKCVVENIYHGDCKGKLGASINTFDICLNNSWYEELLSH